jgi:GNAT superfamily N-acetyltransferase
MTETPLEDLPLPDGKLAFLSSSEAAMVLDLYGRCRDYFLLQDGEAAGAPDAEALFTDVPPSKGSEDQLVIGYWRDGKLMGVAALLRHYPNETDWYLGFLLLDPSIRRRGLGRTIYKAIERWSAQRGARRMLLAVLDCNDTALEFWRALGFKAVRTVEASAFKSKLHVRQELVRQL